ncbi:tetratricopeptide repeat protein [Aliiglaciecola sp. SL4]|uniref:tetratricopeptide repeat protein n=1 Tax=Aliiglaciecola sp. SL4 TaxID=3239806 RepID=UPI00355B91B5
MSVVNKMLQDLEERKADPELSADYRPSTESKKSFLSIYAFLIVLIIICVFWFFKDSLFTQKNETGELIDTVEKSEKSSQIELVEKPYLAPEVVTDTQINNQLTVLDNDLVNQSEQLSQAKLNDNLGDSKNAKSQVENTDNELLHSIEDDVVEAEQEIQLVAQVGTDEITKVEQKLTKMKSASKPPEPKKVANVDTDGSVFEMKSSKAAVDKEALKQQVQVALKRGDDRTAIKLLAKLVHVTPDNTAARKRLASMLFAQGNHEKANTTLQTGVDLYPGNLELRIMQARLYEQMKKPDQGFELLMAHRVSAYQAPDYLAYRAALAQKANNFAQARIDYQQLAKSQSANAKWWLGLAVVEERLGNMNGALDAYQNVKQLSQMSVEVEEFVEQRIRYLAGVK